MNDPYFFVVGVGQVRKILFTNKNVLLTKAFKGGNTLNKSFFNKSVYFSVHKMSKETFFEKALLESLCIIH